MATRAHSTIASRRRLYRAEQRAALYAIIERALALLDALDGDPDLEPEPAEEDDAEANLQPVTLAPDRAKPIRLARPVTVAPVRIDATGNRPVAVRHFHDPEEGRLGRGLRNAVLLGSGFWLLVGLAGWGLA